MAERRTPEEIQAEIDALEKKQEKLEQEKSSIEDVARVTRELAAAKIELMKANKEDADAIAKALVNYDKLVETQNKASQASKSYESNLRSTFKTLTGVTSASDSLIGSFLELGKETGNNEEALKKLKDVASDTFSVFNIGVSITRKVFESSVMLTTGLDSAQASFAKAAGTGGRYNDAIKQIEKTNRQFGVTAGEATVALGSLHSDMTQFLFMSQESQIQLANTVAQMEKFGISTGTTTEFLEGATRLLGMTSNAAVDLANSVMATASEFGDNLNEVMQETANVLPKIALPGAKTEKVLKNLYRMSKLTGMGMTEIVDAAQQFDTFDAAATAAGNLNAVLKGQYLDTLQILETTDPAERMELFADAIQNASGGFESLGYYQQQAVANAMGMSVEQVRTMVLQEKQATELEKTLERNNMNAEEYEELMGQSRDLAADFKILIAEAGVAMEPVIGALKQIVHWMSKILGNPIMGSLIKFGLPLMIAGKGLGLGLKGLAAMGTGLKDRVMGTGAAFREAGGGLKGMVAAGKSLLGFGAKKKEEDESQLELDFTAEGRAKVEAIIVEEDDSPTEKIKEVMESAAEKMEDDSDETTKITEKIQKKFFNKMKSWGSSLHTTLGSWAGRVSSSFMNMASSLRGFFSAGGLGRSGLGMMGKLGIGALGAYGAYKTGSYLMGKRGERSLKETGIGIAGGAASGAAIGSVIPVVGTAAGAVIGGLLGGGASLFDDGGKAVTPTGVSPNSPLLTTVSAGELMIPPARKGGNAQDALGPLMDKLETGFKQLGSTMNSGLANTANAARGSKVVMDQKQFDRMNARSADRTEIQNMSRRRR